MSDRQSSLWNLTAIKNAADKKSLEQNSFYIKGETLTCAILKQIGDTPTPCRRLSTFECTIRLHIHEPIMYDITFHQGTVTPIRVVYTNTRTGQQYKFVSTSPLSEIVEYLNTTQKYTDIIEVGYYEPYTGPMVTFTPTPITLDTSNIAITLPATKEYLGLMRDCGS